ncbi:uncharacterized protein [Diabrotica undecimpunctata]|uniref:uncharacterized protein n=1 Tax=Diabrotica undecimpunctata TaxID=50387 RepID=UPI003B634B4C
MGITRLDRIRNEAVREHLKVQSIIQKIEEAQLRWYGHIVRMNQERPVKKVWEARIQTKRPRRRPMKTWDDNVTSILETGRGISKEQARNQAKNKKQWRKIVHATN